jgi:uncharacterized protein (UPF0335 family)
MSENQDQDRFREAVMLVWRAGKCSTSYIQRHLGIGYNAAARLVERMEEMAIVSAPDHVGKREVRSPDDLRKALSIRDEVIDIVEGDEEKARIMFDALIAGFKGIPEARAQVEAEATMTISTANGAVTVPFDAATLKASLGAELAGKPLTRAQVEAMQKKKPDPQAPEFEVTKDHNYAVTAEELRQIVERAEQLAAEKRDIAEQEKELFAEAKGRGYDTKVLRKVIALRKRKPDEVAEEEAVLEMYCAALGMR